MQFIDEEHKPLGRGAIGTLSAVFLPQGQKQPAGFFLQMAIVMS